MKYYFYPPGTTRAFRWHGINDPRTHRPPVGWSARAELTDIHPTTGEQLESAEWWIIETKE